MQQVNQNEQVVGAGTLIFFDMDRQIKYATTQGFDFSHKASKEECYHCATMLNGYKEVTEEREAVELLCRAIQKTEDEMDDGKISSEECQQGCEGFRWMIASLIGSAYWMVTFLQDDKAKVIGMKDEALTDEEFAKRDQDIASYFEKLAA